MPRSVTIRQQRLARQLCNISLGSQLGGPYWAVNISATETRYVPIENSESIWDAVELRNRLYVEHDWIPRALYQRKLKGHVHLCSHGYRAQLRDLQYNTDAFVYFNYSNYASEAAAKRAANRYLKANMAAHEVLRQDYNRMMRKSVLKVAEAEWSRKQALFDQLALKRPDFWRVAFDRTYPDNLAIATDPSSFYDRELGRHGRG